MVHILRTIKNGNIRTIFPCSRRKTRSDEPWVMLIGAVVPEIQPHLCKWGGKGMTNGAGGLGVGAKRVSDRGLLHFRHIPKQRLTPDTDLDAYIHPCSTR